MSCNKHQVVQFYKGHQVLYLVSYQVLKNKQNKKNTSHHALPHTTPSKAPSTWPLADLAPPAPPPTLHQWSHAKERRHGDLYSSGEAVSWGTWKNGMIHRNLRKWLYSYTWLSGGVTTWKVFLHPSNQKINYHHGNLRVPTVPTPQMPRFHQEIAGLMIGDYEGTMMLDNPVKLRPYSGLQYFSGGVVLRGYS